MLRLKLFENVFGEIISIENKTSIIIDRNIPLNGLQQLFPSTNYYVAYNDNYLKDVFDILDIKALDVNEFYEKYIDVLNVNLSFENKNSHLVIIKDKLNIISAQLIELNIIE